MNEWLAKWRMISLASLLICGLWLQNAVLSAEPMVGSAAEGAARGQSFEQDEAFREPDDAAELKEAEDSVREVGTGTAAGADADPEVEAGADAEPGAEGGPGRGTEPDTGAETEPLPIAEEEPGQSEEELTGEGEQDFPGQMDRAREIKSELDAGSPIIEVPATDDTYTRPGSGPFGSEKTMNVKSNSSGSDIRRAYLKFSLPELEGLIEQAAVKVYVNALESSTPADGYDVTLFGVDDDSWDEETLVDGNQPAEPAVALDTLRVDQDTVGTYIEFDVTAFIQGQTDGQASFYMESTARVSRGAHYRTKEHEGTTPPLLAFTVKDYAVPPAPGLLQVETGSQRVGLSWSPVEHAVFYRVERSTDGGNHYETVAQVHTTGFTDENVSNDVTYIYRIIAANDQYASVPSEPVEATPRYPLVVLDPQFTDLSGRKVTQLPTGGYVNSRIAIENLTGEEQETHIKLQWISKDRPVVEDYVLFHKTIASESKEVIEVGFHVPRHAEDYLLELLVTDRSGGSLLYHPKHYFSE